MQPKKAIAAQAEQLRVLVLGLRGFPDIQGGVEKHVENLAPLLVALGCDLEIIVRSPYVRSSGSADPHGVRFRRVWAPRSRSFEALIHTFLGVLYASLRRPHILHIHAIGPALLTPLARILGLRVVVTHHGADYEREKWGRVARSILKLGEWAGMRFANARIAISKHVQQSVKALYGVDCAVIPNGVALPQLPTSLGFLTTLGLEPGKYVLMVSRVVEEKRHPDLIAAFARADVKGWKLVLVGGADHPDDYTLRVSELVRSTNGAISTGFVSGLPLQELYTHAAVFVLPSSHEGLPIALLEALSYGLPALASDIPANREIGLAEENYFPVGDVPGLSQRLRRVADTPAEPGYRDRIRQTVCSRFDWRQSAAATAAVYKTVACSSETKATPLKRDV